MSSVIQDYNSKVDSNSRIDSETSPGNFSQRNLSNKIDDRQASLLRHDFPFAIDRSRLDAISHARASDWLNVTPSPGLNQKLEPNEFQVLIKMRLGLPLNEDNAKCRLCPGKVLDNVGYHAVTCKRGPDIIHRHNTIRDTIFSDCRKAMMNPKLEQGAGLSSDSNHRPADILVPSWSLGKSAALDITVVHPLNQNTNGASTTEECLKAAETRKHMFNDNQCGELNWSCVPLAVTIFGVWGGEGMNAIQKIADRKAIQTNASRSVTLKEMYGRLAVCLARCTARAILSRTPV